MLMKLNLQEACIPVKFVESSSNTSLTVAIYL